MGRSKKFVNKSEYPDFVIETLARTFYDNMMSEIAEYEEDIEIADTVTAVTDTAQDN